MSFLDNLENTLKNLERGEEMSDNRQRREAEQATARAASPWAEQLKTMFDLAKRKAGLTEKLELNADKFRVPGAQMGLFD